MNKNFGKIATVIAITAVSTVHALVGIGFHWGIVDNTLDMEDKFNQPVTATTGSFDASSMLNNISSSDATFGSVKQELYNVLSTNPITANGTNISSDTALFNYIGSPTSNLSSTLPITLSRSDWTRSKINIGGKFFFDKIKYIDAIEASFNIGVWEYKSILKYPSGTRGDISASDIQDFINTGDYGKIFTMDSIDLSLEKMGINYLKMFGVSQTPLSRIHIDLTIRKNLIAKPDIKKIFKLYLGGGLTLHYATPIITPEFVNSIIGEAMSSDMNGLIGELTKDNDAIMKKVLDELVKKGKDPTFGMHILVGTMVKLPVIPIGIYVDGKFMIPFGEISKDVDLGGFGFVVNAGVSLSIGN